MLGVAQGVRSVGAGMLRLLTPMTLLLMVAVVEAAEDDSRRAPLLQEAVKNIEFSGFLSVRGGQIREDDLVYANKYDDRWTFSEESVFGLQMNSSVSESVNVSLQITAAGGDNPVDLQWAYLEYAFDVDLSARFGRLRAPGFMLSEFLDVGYAYPWVQTPYEVYGWLPFSRYEGMDLRYMVSIAETDIRFNPYLGTTSGQGLSIGEVEYTDQTSEFAGLDVQATIDILTVRVGYSKYKFVLNNSQWDQFIGQTVDGVVYVPAMPGYRDEVKLPGFVDIVEDILIGSLDYFIANPGAAASLGVTASENELLVEKQSLQSQLPAYQSIPAMDGDSDGSFAGVGFSIDNGKHLVMSELSHSKIGGVYPDVASGYLFYGYRFGAWMPNITFAKMYTTDDNERPDLGELQLNPDIWYSTPDSLSAQAADGARLYSHVLAVANDLVRLEQETLTLGLRWDPLPGMAVKTEVFQMRPTDNSYGFALPSVLLDVSGQQASALEDFEIPAPPEKVRGVRMSIDAVF